MDAERANYILNEDYYAVALGIFADDYRFSLQLWLKHLLRRNEGSIQILEQHIWELCLYQLSNFCFGLPGVG
jgi:hypothetical protein